MEAKEGAFYHPKVTQKVDLVEQRLSRLKAENLCNFELNWGAGSFMELILKPIEN